MSMKEKTKLYNYVYKITNNINGKYYYGKRSSDLPPTEDPYMGSGTGIKRAHKKYGIENFTKEIISLHNTWLEAYEAEAEIVTPEMINSPVCYNMKTGGFIGNECVFTDDVKDRISKGVKKYADDNKELMVERARRAVDSFKKKSQTERDEIKKKISESLKKNFSIHGHKSKGRVQSDLEKDKRKIVMNKKEVKEKTSKKSKEMWSNLTKEERVERNSYLQDPDIVKKRGDNIKAALNDPETRKKFIEAHRNSEKVKARAERQRSAEWWKPELFNKLFDIWKREGNPSSTHFAKVLPKYGYSYTSSNMSCVIKHFKKMI